MDAGKPLKTVLLTGYTPDASILIQNLIKEGTRLESVIFTCIKKRLSWKARLKNLINLGTFNEPSRILRKNNIPYFFTSDHNSREVQERLKKGAIDLVLLYGTKIISKSVLNIPKVGTLNAHSALLPKYRGTKAEFWLLFNNEPECAGVTIHWVTPGLDEGDIFLQQSLAVDHDETPVSLRAKSVPLAARLFSKAIISIESGNIVRIPQDNDQATKFKRPTKEQVREYNERYEK